MPRMWANWFEEHKNQLKSLSFPKVLDLPHPHGKENPAPKSPPLCQGHFYASLNHPYTHTHTVPPHSSLGAPH